jgi:energy-coupling factor transporter ATP-binding protein EcfA2
MGKILIVVGPTGSGKSRSIKNLDPAKTVVVNVLKKDLPFKGSRALYSAQNKNLANLDKWDDVVGFIEYISSSQPHITTLVIDDARFIVEKELFRRAKETGYGKFTEMAAHFQKIIETAENARGDLNVVLMLHDDDVISDGAVVAKKVKMSGKMIEDHYNPLEVVPICLYCKPSMEKTSTTYQFYTHKCMVGTAEIPAKTPEDMFTENTIPNDLALVFKAMDEYYG